MYGNRVRETTVSIGLGNITLAGALQGFKTFNAEIGINNQFEYTIENFGVVNGAIAITEWEVGEGHLLNATTLVRDTVLDSSNAGAFVDFGTGTKVVFNTPTAEAANRWDAGGTMGLDDLTDVAITAPVNDDFIQRKAGVFVNRNIAQVKTDLAINNINNTADVDKPISTATQTALDGKVDENTPITGATKTKITYDAKGLVTSGADATTTDIGEGTNLYFTDERGQDAVGNILADTNSIDLTYNDAAPSITADVKKQNSSTVNLSIDASGLKADVNNNTSTQKIEVTKNSGAVVGTRKQLNFIEGSNVTLTVADDAGNDQVDITIETSGLIGGSAHTIKESGVPLTQRTGLNFLSGFDVSDDMVGDETEVTLDLSEVAGGGDLSWTGNTPTIPNNTVTYAKMQDVSATDKLLGRVSAGAGDVEEITCTDFAQSLLDDADAATARTTLGASATGHTHSSTDVTDFTEAVQDVVGSLVVDSSTIDATYNDAGNTESLAVIANSSVQKVAARKNSTGGDVGTRRRINFIEGTNVTITLADDGTDDELDVTIAATGGGGGLNNVVEDTTPQLGGDLDANGFQVSLFGGSTSKAPLKIAAGGSLLTTPEDGAIEMDADCMYGTVDAGNRGYFPITHLIRQDADYTLANQTAAQKLFNSSTNGAITLETGVYKFKALVYVANMSATSGNATFSLAGTATLANVIFAALGRDQTPDQGPNNWSGTYSNDATLTAAPAITAGVATAMCAILEGTFEVSAGGTVIPSIALQTAIGTAQVVAGSYFEITRMGSTSRTTIGDWS